MLTEEERCRAAKDILRAETERKAIPQLSRTYPAMEIEDAYRVQDLWAEARIAKGARMVGHKIGLTSRAMQTASKMTEPDYGRILDDALYNDGAQIRADAFLKPRLEVELAFVMGEDLGGPGARIYDVMRATEFVVPALEIIDYRTEVPRAIVDTIADNAAFAAIVVGGRTIRPMDVDIRWVGATLSKNGIIEESGVSAAIMGHPAAGIAWLVNKLHAVDAKLKRGQIVLAGSFTRPVDIAAGDVIHADYGPLGAIGVSFCERAMPSENFAMTPDDSRGAQARLIGWCRPLADAPLMRDVGLDFIEVALAPLGLENAESFAEAKRQVTRSALPTLAFNNFLPQNLRVVGPEADIPRFKVYLARAAELLAHGGGRIVVYGSGWARNVPDGYERARAEAEFTESLRLSADALAGTGTTLVIEPLNRAESNIVNSVAEGVRFAEAVSRPEVEVLADFYHMDEENEPLDELVFNAGWLAHVHLADTGRMSPGTGSYPYDRFFARLREARYQGMISAECGVNELEADMRASLAFLRGFWS